MPDLWSILGYDIKAGGIARTLDENRGVVVVEGPPGVGKSWLAQAIGGAWESSGGSTVVALGDSHLGQEAYHPFRLERLVGLTDVWKSMAETLATVARAGELLLGSGGLITTLVERLLVARSRWQKARTPLLDDLEREVLSRLERLSDGKPLLLIADNAHWWDAKSLAFLVELCQPRMWDAFPFLAEMRVLAIETTARYQPVSNPRSHDALIALSATPPFELEQIPPEGFETVLEALGAGAEPPARVTETVYQLSGGHLALASLCAARIRAGEVDAFMSVDDADDFVHTLLTRRMRALGANGERAVALLQTAAVVGLSFRRDELVCAYGSSESETGDLLLYCSQEHVLNLDEESGRFIHDVYRQHFLNAAAEDERLGIHGRLAKCLQDLRPADYGVRCRNALDADRPRDAAVLAAHAALQAERDGRPWHELPTDVRAALSSQDLAPVVERLVAAHRHLHDYRFGDCLRELNGLPARLPEPLPAEVDFIRASCLLSTRSDADRVEARSILKRWDGLEADEPELGIRLMQLHLYAVSLLTDKTLGQELETRLNRVLRARMKFDVAAIDAVFILERCAGSLHHPDFAVDRNRRAVDYFGPDDGHVVLRRPVEYYKSLVNLGANLIETGEYREALGAYADVEKLVAAYAPGTFSRLDYARMNALQAEYRLDLATPNDAVDRQRAIVDSLEVAGDPFYPENALAVYLALADRPADAIALFDHLLAELSSRRNPEPSMVYLLRANRCAARFVSGEIAEAQSEWPQLRALVDRIPYVIRDVLAGRHELLGEVIADGAPMSARALDACLLERPPEFGRLWRQLGHGFRLPEVQWWR